jgi:hypothetical protein
VFPLLESSDPKEWKSDVHLSVALDAYGYKVAESIVPGVIATYKAVLTKLSQEDVFPTDERVRFLVKQYARPHRIPKVDRDALALEVNPIMLEMKLRDANVLSRKGSPIQVNIYDSSESLHQQLVSFSVTAPPTPNPEYLVFIQSALGFKKSLPADTDMVEKLRRNKSGFDIFFDDPAGQVSLKSEDINTLNRNTQPYLVLGILLKNVREKLTVGELAVKLGVVLTDMKHIDLSFEEPMIRNIMSQLRQKHAGLKELIQTKAGYRIEDNTKTCFIVRLESALLLG